MQVLFTLVYSPPPAKEEDATFVLQALAVQLEKLQESDWDELLDLIRDANPATTAASIQKKHEDNVSHNRIDKNSAAYQPPSPLEISAHTFPR